MKKPAAAGFFLPKIRQSASHRLRNDGRHSVTFSTGGKRQNDL